MLAVTLLFSLLCSSYVNCSSASQSSQSNYQQNLQSSAQSSSLYAQSQSQSSFKEFTQKNSYSKPADNNFTKQNQSIYLGQQVSQAQIFYLQNQTSLVWTVNSCIKYQKPLISDRQDKKSMQTCLSDVFGIKSSVLSLDDIHLLIVTEYNVLYVYDLNEWIKKVEYTPYYYKVDYLKYMVDIEPQISKSKIIALSLNRIGSNNSQVIFLEFPHNSRSYQLIVLENLQISMNSTIYCMKWHPVYLYTLLLGGSQGFYLYDTLKPSLNSIDTNITVKINIFQSGIIILRYVRMSSQNYQILASQNFQQGVFTDVKIDGQLNNTQLNYIIKIIVSKNDKTIALRKNNNQAYLNSVYNITINYDNNYNDYGKSYQTAKVLNISFLKLHENKKVVIAFAMTQNGDQFMFLQHQSQFIDRYTRCYDYSYYFYGNQQCGVCSSQCKTCHKDAKRCTSCFDTTFLLFQTCTPCTHYIIGCKICFSSESCFQCYQQKNFVKDYAQGYGCKCKQGYYNNYEKESCQCAMNGCLECYFPGFCMSCRSQQNYILNKNLHLCQCRDGYYFQSLSKSCKLCRQQIQLCSKCIQNVNNASQIFCVQCQQQTYQLKNNSCVSIQSNITVLTWPLIGISIFSFIITMILVISCIYCIRYRKKLVKSKKSNQELQSLLNTSQHASNSKQTLTDEQKLREQLI